MNMIRKKSLKRLRKMLQTVASTQPSGFSVVADLQYVDLSESHSGALTLPLGLVAEQKVNKSILFIPSNEMVEELSSIN